MESWRNCKTLILSRTDMMGLLTPAEYVNCVEQAYRMHGEGRYYMDPNGMDRPAPPPEGTHGARAACHRRSTTMPRTATVHAVSAIGIDMGKNTLHMVGLDTRGTVVRRHPRFDANETGRQIRKPQFEAQTWWSPSHPLASHS